jgi:hypothetical protein
MAETEEMLPKSQIGGRRGRGTESALELLTEQVHTIWGTGQNVATLLSLDISGAFDTVDPMRLQDTLRARGVPLWMVRWVGSFIESRQTTLLLQGRESMSRKVPGGVPQGSPLSPILFLFYNAGLLELCENHKLRTTGIGFIDDANILAYGLLTSGNYIALEQIHVKLL